MIVPIEDEMIESLERNLQEQLYDYLCKIEHGFWPTSSSRLVLGDIIQVTIGQGPVTKLRQCECGAESVGVNNHSNWCPKCE